MRGNLKKPAGGVAGLHLGLLLCRWIIMNLFVYRMFALPLRLLERRLKLQGVATAVAMLPAIAICTTVTASLAQAAHSEP